jgi:hypothetical protein
MTHRFVTETVQIFDAASITFLLEQRGDEATITEEGAEAAVRD